MFRFFGLSALLFPLTAATVVLTGCGNGVATQLPSSTTSVVATTSVSHPAELQPGDGGAFSAGYKGTARGSRCRLGHEEDLVFEGHGEASFLHQSREHAIVLMTQGPMDCEPVEADFDLFSDNPNDSIWGLVHFSPDGDWKGKYRILGGFGKFKHATG